MLQYSLQKKCSAASSPVSSAVILIKYDTRKTRLGLEMCSAASSPVSSAVIFIKYVFTWVSQVRITLYILIFLTIYVTNLP